MTNTRTDVSRWLAVVAVVAFLGVLLWYLAQPGYTHVRLVFFAVLGGLAVVGAVGVVYRSTWLTTAGIAGLLLLGFWQAVLWLYIYPLVGLLVVASLLDDRNGREQPTTT